MSFIASRSLIIATLASLAGSAGCTPSDAEDGFLSGTSLTVTAGGDGGTTTGPGPTIPPHPYDDDTGGEDDGAEGCNFTCPRPPPVPEPPGGGEGGGGVVCDLFVQTCSPGDRCVAHSTDDEHFDATWCLELLDDRAGVGERCLVFDGPLGGVDDCDRGTQCWNVEGHVGECVAYCQYDLSCTDPDRGCITDDGHVPWLCLPRCDPLVQDCPAGQPCVFADDEFACLPVPAQAGPGQHGDPCSTRWDCQLGHHCTDPDLLPGCLNVDGCCAAYCDLGSVDPAARCLGINQGEECVDHFDNTPTDAAHLGLCRLP